MKLRKYYEVARIAFLQATTYRLDAVTTFFSSLIFLLLYYTLWSSIAGAGALEGGLDRVMAYLVAGQVVSNTAFMGTEQFFGYKIRQGTIVNELKRPLGLMAHTYFHELGWSSFNFVTKALPVAAAGVLLIGVELPPLPTLLVFMASTFLAFNLVFLLAYITSMFIFWTKVDWSLRMTRNTVQNLFSGVLFPLYLLPDGLHRVFSYLPFQAMADSPIRIFTMQATGSEIYRIFAVQLFWIGVMFVLALLAWSKAKKKLTVQGG